MPRNIVWFLGIFIVAAGCATKGKQPAPMCDSKPSKPFKELEMGPALWLEEIREHEAPLSLPCDRNLSSIDYRSDISVHANYQAMAELTGRSVTTEEIAQVQGM